MNTYAIIEAGGEQLRVEPGRFYDIRFPYSVQDSYKNAKLIFSRVLMIRHESTTLIGKPWLKDTLVKGRIFHPRRAEKILVYKMRPKKKTRKKNSHRQPLIRFLVDTISFKEKS